MKGWRFSEKMIVKAMKTPTGDYRDWEAIDACAESIANELQVEVSV
jgi:hypothetical protein